MHCGSQTGDHVHILHVHQAATNTTLPRFGNGEIEDNNSAANVNDSVETIDLNHLHHMEMDLGRTWVRSPG